MALVCKVLSHSYNGSDIHHIRLVTYHLFVCSFVINLAVFLISNFCLVLSVVFFLLCDSPASEFYVPMFRNNLLDLCKQEE